MCVMQTRRPRQSFTQIPDSAHCPPFSHPNLQPLPEAFHPVFTLLGELDEGFVARWSARKTGKVAAGDTAPPPIGDGEVVHMLMSGCAPTEAMRRDGTGVAAVQVSARPGDAEKGTEQRRG